MILYRGASNREGFGDNGQSENLKMGPGIYMSDLEYVAKCYGHVRRIQVEQKNIVLMNNRSMVSKLLSFLSQQVLVKFKLAMGKYIQKKTFEDIIASVIVGEMCIINIPREISLWLDATESYYDIDNPDTSDVEAYMDAIVADFCKKHVVGYNDNEIDGLVYFTTNPSLLSILEEVKEVEPQVQKGYYILDIFGNRKDMTKKQVVEMLEKAKSINWLNINPSDVTKKVFRVDNGPGVLIAVKLKSRWYKVLGYTK